MTSLAIPILLPLLVGGTGLGAGYAASEYATTGKVSSNPFQAITTFSTIAKLSIVVVAGAAAYYFISRWKR